MTVGTVQRSTTALVVASPPGTIQRATTALVVASPPGSVQRSTTALVVLAPPVNYVYAPQSRWTLTAFAPAVVEIRPEVPTATLTLSAFAPEIAAASPAWVESPPSGFAVSAHPPTIITVLGGAAVPRSAFALSAFAPTLAAEDSAVTVPLALLNLTAYAPAITRINRLTVTESMTLDGRSTATLDALLLATDAAQTADALRSGAGTRGTESAATTTAMIGGAGTLGRESSRLAETPTATGKLTGTGSDAVTTADRQRSGAGTQGSETATLTETPRFGLSALLREALDLADVLVALARATTQGDESLSLDDAVSYAIATTLSDGFDTTDTIRSGIVARLLETFAASAQPIHAIRSLLAESFGLTDAIKSSFLYTLSDSFAVTDTSASTLFALMQARDTLAFASTLTLDDGDYEMWALNADTLGATRYTGLRFNALATHEGRTFGCSEVGLYELIGDTDDGADIPAWFRTGMLDFGNPHVPKSCARAYLYGESDDTLILRVFTDDRSGCRKTDAYRLTLPVGGTSLGNRTVKLGRGAVGTRWGFQVENVSGASIEVRGLEVLPVALRYRP